MNTCSSTCCNDKDCPCIKTCLDEKELCDFHFAEEALYYTGIRLKNKKENK